MRLSARFIFLTLLFSKTVFAGNLGLGVILFGPTGFSGNYFIQKSNSIDAAFSWDLNDNDQDIYIHGTYLWHRRDLIKVDQQPFDLFFGFGGRIVDWNDPPGKDRDSETRLGLRGSGGVGYTFQKPRIELFGELSLTMDVIPETDADVDFALGGRFYF